MNFKIKLKPNITFEMERTRHYAFKFVLIAILVCFMISAGLFVYYTDCMSLCNASTIQSKQDEEKEKAFSELQKTPKGCFRKQEAVELMKNLSNWQKELEERVNITKEEADLRNETCESLDSDHISLNRSLLDVRMEGCKGKQYSKVLPTTSIVMVFHNEPWLALVRTVHNVVQASPRPLIHEIILVIDAMERDYLDSELENYVITLEVPIRVIRTNKQFRLTKARLIGAEVATGQVITFLDAHCECTEGWLEPLLDRIAEDRTKVVCPIIDVINDKTFEYIVASDMTWVGFNWKFNFRSFRMPQREMDRRGGDRTLPIRTPAITGEIFAIDRKYFEEIGKFDEGMDLYGGHNLELSLRIWMCGGTLEIVTCSHVGRAYTKSTYYSLPANSSEILNRNNIRLAEVWLDDWKDFYYTIHLGARYALIDYLAPRKKLREDLKCKSFRWYLENIYPESQIPIDYFYFGEIKNWESGICLDTFGRSSGENIGMTYCHGLGGKQVFAYTKNHQIMFNDNCLDTSNRDGQLKLLRCLAGRGNPVWMYNKKEKTMIHMQSGQCLDGPNDSDFTLPTLKKCDGRPSQKWIMNGNWRASDQLWTTSTPESLSVIY